LAPLRNDEFCARIRAARQSLNAMARLNAIEYVPGEPSTKNHSSTYPAEADRNPKHFRKRSQTLTHWLRDCRQKLSASL
jgi:hypothetical protein